LHTTVKTFLGDKVMQLTVKFFAILLFIILPLRAQALTLATNGLSAVVIVVADQLTPAELTAAQELASYLGKITGGKFTIQPESTHPPDRASIYVGPTRTALKAGVDCSKLGPEEWAIRTSGPDLILAGGRPRGTVYATYHFLEDVLAVHWWNPWEESVPKRPVLAVGPLNLRGSPVFRYRDIYMLYGNDSGRFAARNRLNRDGDTTIDSRYGGSMSYGPPYHVHTFSLYFPPQQYFNKHPEWYSLINGKRSGYNSQLCLTNTELRKAFLAKLIEYIESSHAQAKAANLPPPMVFSVSQNDNLNPCQCEKCQAIAKAEESESGPLLDFVNFLADGIRNKYPDVMIDTLAYQYTQKLPRTIKPRDNVIIRLCDTESDLIRPITDPVNKAFRDRLTAWARITKNLRVWNYAVTYTSPIGMPLPSIETYQTNYQFYASNNVEGIFTEHEYPILADMRDFKVWMMIKLLEDPYADVRKLEDTFISGFYGPATPMIQQYLADLNMEAMDRGARTNWMIPASKLSYINTNFVIRAQTLFEQAERIVSNDAMLLRRVRHARLSLDRASMVLFIKLYNEWIATGGDKGRFPLDRDKLANRVLQTWSEQADLRMTGEQRAAEKQRAEAEVNHYTSLPASVALPLKFRDLPSDEVFAYTAYSTRNWQNISRVVPDKDAESGITNFLDLTAANVENAERYVLPMTWGLYDTNTKKGIDKSPIRAEDVPGPGYNWYKMGTYAISSNHYLYLFWSWIIQLDVGDLFDGSKPDQKYDVWARIKFTGPRFPYARAGDKDAIYVERVVLVKTR
jgi:hypothetical protein